MKISEHLKQWLKNKEGQVEVTTYQTLCNVVNVHMIPYFLDHDKDIIDVKPKDIQEYINYKLKNGRRDNKQGGLSPASMKKQKSILTQMFNDIMYEDIIKNNPVYVCKIKRTKTLSRKAKFLTIVQAKEVISIFKNDILYIPVKLAIYYGMRRSEILGLQWENINLEEETITIKNTLVKINTVIYKESLKTEYSEGTYKLYHDLVSDLKQMKIKKTGFVFQYNGKPIRPDYLTKHFQKVLKQNNYPKMRFHDLRHTTASILFELGMNPKDVQLYMRHSDIETTMNIYTHYSSDRKAKISNELEDVFK